MKILSEDRSFPTWKLCDLLDITRSAYYRWLTHPTSSHELENERIAIEVEEIHKAHPDMGYRRIRDELDRKHDIHVNDKRVLRIDPLFIFNQRLSTKGMAAPRAQCRRNT